MCIDETHKMQKKKKNRGGFQGRNTLAHQTIIMAGVELDGPWAGRKQTGRAFMVVVTDKSAETFKQVLWDDYETEVQKTQVKIENRLLFFSNSNKRKQHFMN